MNDIVYRAATADDYKAVNDFYNWQYNEARPLSYWSWAYEENPMGKGALFLATHREKVVGIQGVIMYLLEIGREVVQTYKSEDTLVDGKMRGKGIFRGLYTLLHDYVRDIPVWGFTDKVRVFSSVDMLSNQALTTYYKVNKRWPFTLDPNTIFQKETLLLGSIWLSQLSRFPTGGSSEVRMQRVDQLSIEDFLFIEENSRSSYRPMLSSDVLEWRLKSNPTIDQGMMYRGVSDGDVLQHIALVSAVGRHAKLLMWTYAEHTSAAGSAAFIDKIASDLCKENVSVLSYWQVEGRENKSTEQIIKKAGLTYARRGLPVVESKSCRSLELSSYTAFYGLS